MTTTPSLPHANCYRIPGSRVIAGEYPIHPGKKEARAKLRGILDAGVSVFIDLTCETEPLAAYHAMLQEEAEARGTELVHQRLPIVDNDVPAPERMIEILDRIDAAEAAGRTVYVHCWGGVGRTGTVVGCYLVRSGMSGDAALEKVNALFGTMSPEKTHRHQLTGSPQTDPQRDFIRTWSEHDAQHAAPAGEGAEGGVGGPAAGPPEGSVEPGVDIDAILHELAAGTRLAPTLFPVVRAALEDRGFDLTVDEAGSRAGLHVQGEHAVLQCYLAAREETQIVHCLVRAPLLVPEEARVAMCEAITRANFGMLYGSFEMDLSDGELRFRTSIDVEGGELVPTMVANLLAAGVAMCDRYHPAFMRIIYGGVPPRQAIEDVEG